MALIALGWLGARATSLASLGSSLVTQTHTESWLRPVLLPEAKAAHQAPSDGAALAHTSPEGVTLPAAEGSPTAPPAGAPGVTVDGKVILNTASEDELRKLPGVGPARAKAILALRARLHRFRKPTDLLRVKGIGPKTLARMLDHLVVDPPATPTPNAGP